LKGAVERAQARRELCEICTDASNPSEFKREEFKSAMQLVDDSKYNPELYQKMTKNGSRDLLDGIQEIFDEE
jgi:hypothetical protein